MMLAVHTAQPEENGQTPKRILIMKPARSLTGSRWIAEPNAVMCYCYFMNHAMMRFLRHQVDSHLGHEKSLVTFL